MCVPQEETGALFVLGESLLTSRLDFVSSLLTFLFVPAGLEIIGDETLAWLGSEHSETEIRYNQLINKFEYVYAACFVQI
jgi:hypothetical protein